MEKIYLLKCLGNLAAEGLAILLRPRQDSARKHPSPHEPPVAVKNILVIKIWGIGNIVLLLPIFKAIKAAYPNSKLSLLTLDSNKTLVQNSPLIDRVFLFKFTKNPLRITLDFLQILLAVKRTRPDLLINFEQCNRLSAAFSYLTGAKIRLGFSCQAPRQDGLYTAVIQNNPSLHVTENFSRLCLQSGIPVGKYEYLPPAGHPSLKNKVGGILRDNLLLDSRIVVFHVGSGINFIGKRWDPANFARLADGLIRLHGIKAVFTGTEDEAPLIKNVLTQMQMKKAALDLCGKLTLPELAEFLRHFYLFVSNDTGPLHIAVSLKMNTAGIYGPMNPVQYGSLNENHLSFYKALPCSPCLTDANNKTSFCKDTKCLNEITVEEVLEKVSEKFFYAPKE